MSWLSSFVEDIAPIVAAVSPEPISRAAAQAKVAYDAQEANKVANIEREEQRKKQMFMDDSAYIRPTARAQPQPTTPSGFFGGVSDFLGSAGSVIGDVASGLGGIFDTVGTVRRSFDRATSSPQPAVDRISNIPRETQQTSQAFLGGLPNVLGTAAKFLRTPGGQIGTGLGLIGATSLMSPSGNKMRVTRKMKSQLRQVYNMTGGNFNATADFFGITPDMVMSILTKRFRNDGPVVTKAALRKTKTTIRRLKHMCDVYDDMRPRAKARTPVRRAATTRITQVK